MMEFQIDMIMILEAVIILNQPMMLMALRRMIRNLHLGNLKNLKPKLKKKQAHYWMRKIKKRNKGAR